MCVTHFINNIYISILCALCLSNGCRRGLSWSTDVSVMAHFCEQLFHCTLHLASYLGNCLKTFISDKTMGQPALEQLIESLSPDSSHF